MDEDSDCYAVPPEFTPLLSFERGDARAMGEVRRLLHGLPITPEPESIDDVVLHGEGDLDTAISSVVSALAIAAPRTPGPHYRYAVVCSTVLGILVELTDPEGTIGSIIYPCCVVERVGENAFKVWVPKENY